MREKLETILDKYITELEEARAVSNKADALICIKEHLINMNMFADYATKMVKLESLIMEQTKE